MTTRYLSVFLPLLPTDRLTRRMGAASRSGRRAPGDEAPAPLVTVRSLKGAQRIAAADAAAQAGGITIGMSLADARAMLPGLAAMEADPAADAEMLTRIVAWCGKFTPLAACDGSDGILLDIGGAAHLFGGEAGLIAAVGQGLRGQGFAVAVAIAGTPESASALARFSPGSIAPARLSPEFDRLMADLPIAALRLDPGLVSAMAQAGLRRIGDLDLRPRAPIAARFGPAVLARLDGLMGRALSAISPHFEAPAYVAERRFASGIVEVEAVVGALLPLCRHLCALLERRHQGARALEASLFRLDGAVTTIVIGTSRPVRGAEALVDLFRLKLEALAETGLEAGYGFELIRLGVSRAEALPPEQEDLSSVTAETPPADLSDLADRMGSKLGQPRILRLEDGDRHCPEGAAVAVPGPHDFMAPRRGETAPAPFRPLRLFEQPEPIETIAAVPDGPPVRFRWRRIMHEIAAIEGPERIAPEWWHQKDALTRDYFQAEDREGRRFWLFREGLFNREVAAARWFLHGLFG